MAEGTPTSYAELISVLEAIPLLLREKRRRDGLSLRAAGDRIGLSASTVMRAEAGDFDPALSSAIRMMRWVGESVRPTDTEGGQ